VSAYRPGAIPYDPDDEQQEDVEPAPSDDHESVPEPATTAQPTSSVFTPGAFVHSTRMRLDPYGAECAFCATTITGAAWVHVASASVVCHACMGNPYDDDGERGRQVHERLVQRLDSERDQLVEPSEPSRLEIL